MTRRIDWTRPCYPTLICKASGSSYYGVGTCSICNRKVRAGEEYRRGPRGAEVAHERCAPPRPVAP